MLLTTYYLLLTTYYLLLTTYYLQTTCLLTTYYLLLATDYLLLATHYLLLQVVQSKARNGKLETVDKEFVDALAEKADNRLFGPAEEIDLFRRTNPQWNAFTKYGLPARDADGKALSTANAIASKWCSSLGADERRKKFESFCVTTSQATSGTFGWHIRDEHLHSSPAAVTLHDEEGDRSRIASLALMKLLKHDSNEQKRREEADAGSGPVDACIQKGGPLLLPLPRQGSPPPFFRF